MKKFLSIGITCMLFSILALSLYSCQHDKCKARAIDCQNEGLCRDGECLCINGFEGDSCQTPMNEKFESYYACIRTELINGTGTNDNDDTLRVIANGDGDNWGVRFHSIRDVATEWEGTVYESEMNIPTQQVGIASYSGNGSLSGDVLTITLFKSDPLNSIDSKTTYVGYKYEAP